MRAQTRLQAFTLASHRARDMATSRLVIGGDEVASGGRSANPSLTLPKGSDPEALFRAYSPWLLRTLQHKFGREIADDLLQETYLRVTRHAATIEILKPKAFLLQVARNVFLNGYRQNRNRAALEQPLLATRAQTTAADQVETIVLKDIILGMPEKLRDVFVLSRFGAMSQQQIADHLGISPKTVEWRMTKALAYCAAQLRE